MSTLNIFAREMNNLAGIVQSNCVKVVAEVTEEVATHVANTTPVLTGQASGNWVTTVGAPDPNYVPGPSSPAASIQSAQAVARSLQIGETVYISNNVPYIVELNQGSSAKAPAGFVESATLLGMNVIGKFNLLVR